MKKIALQIDSLDNELLDQLIYLERLVTIVYKYFDRWKADAVEISTDSKIVRVKLGKKSSSPVFTEWEFPVQDLQHIILYYQRRLREGYYTRHFKVKTNAEVRMQEPRMQ